MRNHYKQHGAIDQDMAEYFLKKREKNVSQETHSCDICGKTFAFRNSIVVHIKLSHAGECLLCGKLVKDMKIHMAEHTKEDKKPAAKEVCPICKLTFTKYALKNHIQNIHEKTRKCPDCGDVIKFHEMRV